ncbi:TRAP transporter small permease [Brachybacterium sp. YJGR34]|uniref:TRAP transporter small permease n=1 Tax=Brachybacterium sp. YJGR34 TaxID=2059911 RepID=UPI001E42F97D|nr:TRAP transporter small permease [Brachybacterium sp. YJGR34]
MSSPAAPETRSEAGMPAQRLRRGLATFLLWFAVVLLVLMTALVLYQVFTRYVLGTPAAFTEELVRYALIWVSFIAATYAFLERGHMALTILQDRFPARARRALRLGIDVLVLALAVLVLGVGGAMLAWDSRENFSALLGISRGWVYLISPIAGAGIALAQVLNILEDLRAPEPSDSSTTAEKEAE